MILRVTRIYPLALSIGASNTVLVPAACSVIRAEPEAILLIGARIEIVRARRLNVARASSSFAVSLSQPAGRGGGVWQYGVLLV